MFRAPCAHRQEVKIVLYSIWYRHTCRWPSRAKVLSSRLNIAFVSTHCAQEARAILETKFSGVQTIQEDKGGAGYGKLRATDTSHVLAKNLVMSCKMVLEIEI